MEGAGFPGCAVVPVRGKNLKPPKCEAELSKPFTSKCSLLYTNELLPVVQMETYQWGK